MARKVLRATAGTVESDAKGVKQASNPGAKIMNWDQIAARWHQITEQLKSKWGKLTDDDLKNIAGKRERLVGKLQERYGILKDQADRQVSDWSAKAEEEPSG